MSYSEWLLPKNKNGEGKRTVRQIFYIKSEDQLERLQNEAHKPGATPLRFLPHLGIVVAESESSLSSNSVESDLDVEYIESDIRITINEPVLGSVRPLDKQSVPWGVESVGAPKVWSKTKGEAIRVAVIDTGIVSDHPVISKNYIKGINILSKKNSPNDYNGHGTHVAGTVAGSASELGLLGVAPGAKIYAVKAFNRKGSANLSDLLSAINWCIENKMHVMNMSFGMAKLSDSLRLAIQVAHRKGIVMVAASGNKGYSDKVDYPARYPETIGVTSISRGGKISSFSNLGKGVDIAAPGDGIPSAWLNNSKRDMSGTSMAVPHVSGAVALLLRLKPQLNPEQVRYTLMNSAKASVKSGDVKVLNVAEAVRIMERL